MRLSFGQELRMVQKQVLAPRMIQSMEILQLPIMALQERIEQEIQENPVLDLAEEGARKHDAMANMVARPQSLQDYLHDQLGWFNLATELRAMCDRIIYNLDANGYLQSRLEDIIDPTAGPEQLAAAQQALGIVQK